MTNSLIPAIADLIDAMRSNPTEPHDFDQYLRICSIANISPFDAAFAPHDCDATINDNPLILDIIRHRHMLFSFADDADYAHESPYHYYSDSCCDDLTEMLDYSAYTDNDPYAIIRRFESYCHDHDIDIIPDHDLSAQITLNNS